MKIPGLVLAAALLVVFAGCQDQAKKEMTLQIDSLRLEKSQLKSSLEHCNDETQQLKGRVRTLSALDQTVRSENPYEPQRVEIANYTGFYDSNKDGKKDILIVYIQPIDDRGDIVKTAGAVDVELWDLDRKDGKAMLAAWHVGPEELKKRWAATLIKISYKLVFDLTGKIQQLDKPLTVRMVFTDYLSGAVFERQMLCKP